MEPAGEEAVLRLVGWETEDDADGDEARPLSGSPVAAKDYKVEDFYTASVNRHDHSDKMTVRAPMQMLTIISALVQSRQVPFYQTQQDFARDAFTHRLAYLSTVYDLPEVKDWVERELFRVKAEKMRALREHLDETVKGWREEVDAWIKSGNVVMMARTREEVERGMGGVMEPWYGEMVRMVGDLGKGIGAG